MNRKVNQLLSKLFQLDIVKRYWASRYQSLSFIHTPWTPLKKPLSEAKAEQAAKKKVSKNSTKKKAKKAATKKKAKKETKKKAAKKKSSKKK